MEYRVVWTIELDADSPEDAARKALAVHRDPGSHATHFEVIDRRGRTWEVDLGCPCAPSRRETVHVLVPMEEGIVRDVQAFRSGDAAAHAEREWLDAKGLTGDKERDAASDQGLGIAVWECGLET